MSLFRDLMMAGGGYDYRNIIVSSGLSLIISSGVSAKNITVNPGGFFIVSNGGTALNVLENGGIVQQASAASVTYIGNTVSGITVTDYMTAHSDTVVSGVHVRSTGLLTTSTVADDITVSNGYLYMSGGSCTGCTVIGGSAFVYSSGVISAVALSSGGSPAASSYLVVQGGSAYDITVRSSCAITLGDPINPSIGSHIILSGGALNLAPSGSAVDVIGLNARILVNGSCDSVTLSAGAHLQCSSGGVATNVTATGMNTVLQLYGGVVRSATITDGAQATWVLPAGGLLDTADVHGNGSITVNSVGTATNIGIGDAGRLTVSIGGLATLLTVSSGGTMIVSRFGQASAATVASGGHMSVASGGTALAVVSNAGADIIVDAGGYIEYA